MQRERCEEFELGGLTIECRQEQDQLWLRWRGRSEARDPQQVLQCVLDGLPASLVGTRSVHFDFRALEYMNSSTIPPLLKLIQSASKQSASVRVLYDGTKSWQRLSFGAIGVALRTLANLELCA